MDLMSAEKTRTATGNMEHGHCDDDEVRGEEEGLITNSAVK